MGASPAADLWHAVRSARLQADKIEHRFNIFHEILALECNELARHLSSIGFTAGLVLTGQLACRIVRASSNGVVPYKLPMPRQLTDESPPCF